ncbi:aromatic ring-hydroxylating oxygenase subunit alpha [Marinivivus vitaminiproducens]|uniref:aromatic ring-hydroxylating oxygenase subunit alpha n=1 Tax=Marinivivus vitaminiproducens TaxID=3035935 RepID=UPI0027AAE49E|nr:aromatic ring-hydroxylating dioxygenase subunit alpha [Geminicoccaceae bacterium SCSIO 64248]
MPDVSLSDLADMIKRHKPGYTLEAPFYSSESIFKTDMDLIFGRHWIFVATEPEVPEPGDYITIAIGTTSVIILRDDDGGVRAFHNVCRHRGARLLHETQGSVGNIVCRYHQWIYAPDGKLLMADHMGEDFDRSCFGLKPVHLENLAGLLFICLADEAPRDFDHLRSVMEPYLAPHQLWNCKVAKVDELVEQGNWKLTMENNRECYHCAGSHPELTQSLFEYGFGFAPRDLDEETLTLAHDYACIQEERTAGWEAEGLPSRLVEEMVDRPTAYRAQRLALSGAGESQTRDTKAACTRLLGDFQRADLGGLHFWTAPNSWHHFMSDHIVTFSATPIGPNRTLLRTTWLVHKEAREGRDYDLENLTAVWTATNDQDGALVGMAQQGAESAGYQPGPYSPHTEDLVDKASRWYLQRLTAELA